MDQEMLRDAARLHQEVEQLEQHCNLIDNEIISLEKLYGDLGQIEKGKGKDILASIGKGIFSPAKMQEESLYVEVGAGIILRKSPEEVRKLVESQIERLRNSRLLLGQQLEMKFSNLHEIMQELEMQEKAQTN